MTPPCSLESAVRWKQFERAGFASVSGTLLHLIIAVSPRATACTGLRTPKPGFNTIVFSLLPRSPVVPKTEPPENSSAGAARSSRSLTAGNIPNPHPCVTFDCAGVDADVRGPSRNRQLPPRIAEISFCENFVDARSTGLDLLSGYNKTWKQGEQAAVV